MRQDRVCSRDFEFEVLRHGVASAGIRYLVKRGNYIAGIYLLAIVYYFRSLVISSLINKIELLVLIILLTLCFLQLYAISPS